LLGIFLVLGGLHNRKITPKAALHEFLFINHGPIQRWTCVKIDKLWSTSIWCYRSADPNAKICCL